LKLARNWTLRKVVIPNEVRDLLFPLMTGEERFLASLEMTGLLADRRKKRYLFAGPATRHFERSEAQ